MDGEWSKEKVLKENNQGKDGWRRVEGEGGRITIKGKMDGEGSKEKVEGELSREEWMEKGRSRRY